jgi:hypothetical protein
MSAQRELSVPASVTADDSAVELLRLWTTDQGERIALRVDLLPPAAWGLILVDLAKHVAQAYAQRGQLTANAAFEAILSGFIAEIGQSTDSPQPE